MAKKKWNDMSDGAKVALVSVAAADAGLRVWAGRDLAGRANDDVNGPKWLWAAGLSVISSMGALPALYLLVGRKRG
ncbi:MAG: hypothetical protein WAW85_15490 [Gordonia sp. (in: high G+C Gram-positive bacteria)]|uniref:hypothetical protein n=1 Tax=Gordonia sp. (in: high G+C Gram-positive bacteria) TaxID=84139 RepID=UPI003BB6F683